MGFKEKSLLTSVANIGPLRVHQSFMPIQVGSGSEALLTDITDVGLFAGVNVCVVVEAVFIPEDFFANCTDVGCLS